MIEKVNPKHSDKVADRIAGAIVDLAYTKEENPKVAVEVLIGHGICHIIAESSVEFDKKDIEDIVRRIAGNVVVDFVCVKQDEHLAENQSEEIRCGDNGIFKGVPLTEEEKELSLIAHYIYDITRSDGKYILDGDRLIICQSNIHTNLAEFVYSKTFNNWGKELIINPLGDWTGGTDVDSGATNRKIGSDMAQSVTGGGLQGKDLSKADVSVNIYAFLKAQELGCTVTACCAIGDKEVTFNVASNNEDVPNKETFKVPYSDIVEIARNYIKEIGGFEKFAEWGLF